MYEYVYDSRGKKSVRRCALRADAAGKTATASSLKNGRIEGIPDAPVAVVINKSNAVYLRDLQRRSSRVNRPPRARPAAAGSGMMLMFRYMLAVCDSPGASAT